MIRRWALISPRISSVLRRDNFTINWRMTKEDILMLMDNTAHMAKSTELVIPRSTSAMAGPIGRTLMISSAKPTSLILETSSNERESSKLIMNFISDEPLDGSRRHAKQSFANAERISVFSLWSKINQTKSKGLSE
ncbi:hypothetical protein BLNAU_7305 [Blattamonas nauphoetae]|uniref:Uncharacterized protein n=1 Tax=Blattamonas nauphoetae TaxID=2049346 RepID=A0ABQ9Y1Q0_9EUKA|nr:hypothetical protein BLNAU_7305 [Blattamonas nauphoetae]